MFANNMVPRLQHLVLSVLSINRNFVLIFVFSISTVWAHFVIIVTFSLFIVPKLLATVNAIIRLLFTVNSKMLSVVLLIVICVVTVFTGPPLVSMCFHVLVQIPLICKPSITVLVHAFVAGFSAMSYTMSVQLALKGKSFVAIFTREALSQYMIVFMFFHAIICCKVHMAIGTFNSGMMASVM